MPVMQETLTPLSETKTAKPFAIKNVLFATDFSATSDAALPYAAAVCRHFGSTLHVAHVLSDTAIMMMTGGVDYVSLGTLYDDAQADAKEKLHQIALRAGDLRLRSYVRHGRVWNNLAAIIQETEIEENAVDLIVLGTHGRTGLGKLLLGSVAEDILRHASCPVLTIGPKVSGRDKLPELPEHGRDLAPLDLDLREVVFATNFEPNADQLAHTAISVAEEFRARLTLLHVIENYAHLGSRPGPIEGSLRSLHQLVPLDQTLTFTPETLIEFGSASHRILEIAAARHADLLVIGARSPAEVPSTHLPWSTTLHVIAGAHCPVLTLRG